jgi:hypothetical protein
MSAEQEDILLGIKEVQVSDDESVKKLFENQENDFAEDFDKVGMETDQTPGKVIMPKFRQKTKSIPEPPNVPNAPKKRGLNLSEILKNKVKSAAVSKPIDLNTLEGQREMINKRDREAKALAKIECIEKMNSIEKHLHHWPVSKNIYHFFLLNFINKLMKSPDFSFKNNLTKKYISNIS